MIKIINNKDWFESVFEDTNDYNYLIYIYDQQYFTYKKVNDSNKFIVLLHNQAIID